MSLNLLRVEVLKEVRLKFKARERLKMVLNLINALIILIVVVVVDFNLTEDMAACNV